MHPINIMPDKKGYPHIFLIFPWKHMLCGLIKNALPRCFSWLLETNEPAHDKTYKMACALSKDSDQPGHPPSLIRVFAVHMKKSGSLALHWAHNNDWVDAQADLSLCWVHTPFCTFCHARAQMFFCGEIRKISGPSCLKLTMLLVNVLLNFNH